MTVDLSVNTYAVLAFYGQQLNNSAVQALVSCLSDWMSRHNCVPTLVSVRGQGFNTTPMAFEKALTTLNKKAFKSVSNLFVAAMEPNWELLARDWIASFDIDVAGYYTIIGITRKELLNDSDLFTDAARALFHLAPYGYGIGYTTSSGINGTMYAAGMNYSDSIAMTDAEVEAEDLVSRWLDVGIEERVWEAGIIRDVYQFNYLNNKVLRRRVNKTTLSKWIANDPANGVLVTLASNIRMWCVEPSQIRRIHDALSDAGLVFNPSEHG